MAIMLAWLAVLFPAWKLFDQVGDQVSVFYRMLGKDISSDWIAVSQLAKDRSILQLFYNPEDTAWLYFWSLIDELAWRLSTGKSFDWQQDLLAQKIVLFIQKKSSQRPTALQIKIQLFDQQQRLMLEHTSGELDAIAGV